MNRNKSRLRIDLKRILAATFLIGFCGTGVLLIQRAQHSNGKGSAKASPTINQKDFEPVAQTSLKHSQRRPQPILSRATAASPTAPPEPPEDLDEARDWARQNLQDALAWLPNAPSGAKRDTVAEITCAQVAESNPAEAVSLAERYSGGCSNLLENLVQQWADQDEASASAYALAKSPGEERDRLLSRVAFARSKENPIEAANLLAEWISPGDVQNEAAMSVLHQWALRDPNAALAWAQLFSEETLRNRAIKEVAVMLPKTPN